MIPEFKITNARHRGPKESVKMNMFVANIEWNMKQLKERVQELQGKVREVNEKNRQHEASLVNSLKERIQHVEMRVEK